MCVHTWKNIIETHYQTSDLRWTIKGLDSQVGAVTGGDSEEMERKFAAKKFDFCSQNVFAPSSPINNNSKIRQKLQFFL